MTDTVHSAQPGTPAPGWYADPGGTGGQRWWSGLGWTESVQLPAALAQQVQVSPPTLPAVVAPAPLPAMPGVAPPPAPVAAPTQAAAPPTVPSAMSVVVPAPAVAPAPFPRSTPPAGPAQVSRFGGPVGIPVATTPTVPVSHRATPAPAPEPALSRGLIIGLVVALVASVGIGIFVWSRGSGDSAAADTGGARGPASVAAAKLDALSLASAEETFYVDHQKYVPIATAPGIVALGTVVVHLSPSDTATISLDPAGVGYCITVESRSPTTTASSTVVYVSTEGGLQPAVVTSCPPSF